MSFADWVKNGWLVAHKSSKQEIANLLGIVARDLKDSQSKDVSDDWQSQSLITRRYRRRRRRLRPQVTAPAATVITTESFSRSNSPWGKSLTILFQVDRREIEVIRIRVIARSDELLCGLLRDFLDLF